jgi:hypothetical protein
MTTAGLGFTLIFVATSLLVMSVAASRFLATNPMAYSSLSTSPSILGSLSRWISL